jgi:hypothetical protein
MRFSILYLLSSLLIASPLAAQTIYAVVLGNQKYVVGSSTLHSGLFRSRDLGRTWEHLGPENLKGFSMDAVDSSRGRILYIAAGNGVHRSTDFGATWKIVTDWRMTEVLDVKVDQGDPRWVYAATAWGFWRSSDAGETWENPEGLLQRQYLFELSLRDNPIEAWDKINCDTTTWQTTYFLSYDHGKTWTMEHSACDITTGSGPSLDHRIFTTAFAKGTELAGTWGAGIFRREGDRWIPSGLEGSQVWRLVVKEY